LLIALRAVAALWRERRARKRTYNDCFSSLMCAKERRAAMSAKEATNVPTGSQDLGATERSGLERPMSNLRLVALIGLSSAVLLLLFAFLLTSAVVVPQSGLLLLSASHILLAAVAGYASLRFGPLLVVAIGLAVLQTVLDLVHFALRAFALSFDFVALGAFFFVAFLLALDALYLASMLRLRSAIDYLQQRTKFKVNEGADLNELESDVRSGLLSQESNTLRVAALFGGFAVTALLFFTILFVGFSPRYAWLTLLHASHIVLALFAIAFFEASTIAAVFFLFFAVGQLTADGVALALRLDGLALLTGTVSLQSIASVIYLLVNIALLLVDAIYVSASLTYAYVRSGADPATTTSMSMVQAQVTRELSDAPFVARLHAMRVRKQK